MCIRAKELECWSGISIAISTTCLGNVTWDNFSNILFFICGGGPLRVTVIIYAYLGPHAWAHSTHTNTRMHTDAVFCQHVRLSCLDFKKDASITTEKLVGKGKLA